MEDIGETGGEEIKTAQDFLEKLQNACYNKAEMTASNKCTDDSYLSVYNMRASEPASHVSQQASHASQHKITLFLT